MTTVDLDCRWNRWRCTPPLAPDEHLRVRHTMALDGFKWDAQVGDVTTLAPFAIVLPAALWTSLARTAETLAAELAGAEAELQRRAELWPMLGLPRAVRRALEIDEPWTPTAVRAIRFDFHPTRAGWRISEANSDVPGGYTEASRFTALMRAAAPDTFPAGDPATTLAKALARQARQHGRIALLAAPGYPEDLQIVANLAALLAGLGVATTQPRPEQLHWHDGIAHVGQNGAARPLDAIYRFYQGELMATTPGTEWRRLFRGGRTAVCNPGAALLTESKRLPLLWPELETPMPTWHALLPTTDHAGAAWQKPRADWVLKGAYSNTGDSVFTPRWSRRDYLSALGHSLLAPRAWIAQQRFETLPLATPLGPLHPCIGVYTIDGRAAGIYGRLAHRQVTDFTAIDAAVLLQN